MRSPFSRPPKRRPAGVHRRIRAAAAVLPLMVIGGCATASAPRTPLPSPGELAAKLAAAGPERPHRVNFGWQYADERGPVRGDGVLRFNPPDSLRLDLFSTGDAAMRVALVDGEVRTAGQIEDVRLPPPAFLYATAGLFRPGREAPEEGWTTDGDRFLSYPASGGVSLVYRLREGKMVRLEERSGGRELRWLELTWPDTGGAWPREAEYRDGERESRARWTVESAQAEEEPFPSEIYELPDAP